MQEKGRFKMTITQKRQQVQGIMKVQSVKDMAEVPIQIDKVIL